MNPRNEGGMALITTLLVLVLLGALLQAFVLSVNSGQEQIGIDRARNQAFYGALAGLEKLTADLGTLFETDYAPSVTEIDGLEEASPSLPGIAYVAPGGGSGYRISYPLDANGNPRAETRTVPSGPYEGLLGLITPYTMTVTARTPGQSEVQMQRSLQTVAVPVFQFGIFSDTDLSFHAGPSFDFGGRVHTNGHLYLAQRNGNTLFLRDKVTAFGEVIRTHMINGESTASTYNGPVSVASSSGTSHNLGRNEGSLVGQVGSAENEPLWTNLSVGRYGGNLRNWRTGARRMDLPLVSMGASPIDIIRRPVLGEDSSSPEVFAQRYFSMASLRILLSDAEADLGGLPSATASAPHRMDTQAPDGTRYASAGTWSEGFRCQAGTPLVGGFIKIEMQDRNRDWNDVTDEILSLGIAGRNLSGFLPCGDHPNAVIRLQRFKDDASNCKNNSAGNFWPNVLYDTREGNPRDNVSTNESDVYLGGVMHYVELDVANLARWFRGEIGSSGTEAIDETGYVVYFSDRRTNRDASGGETAEYGFEDFVNSGNATTGSPDGYLEEAEDVNGNGLMEDYGKIPRLPPGSAAPMDGTARPWTKVDALIARRNRPLFFRRALKLVHGASINLGSNPEGIPHGLTVASENPVYIQGHYNANGSFGAPHVASAVIADAVTFLSRNWNDRESFLHPHKPSGRRATDTFYRTALISGKGRAFDRPSGQPDDFGTDGGVHNFIRFLEDWTDRDLNYRGSLISLFHNRQAVGTYKCCTNVYSPPTRGYKFEVEFLEPSRLPPRTPMFRDVNITGFTRIKVPE